MEFSRGGMEAAGNSRGIDFRLCAPSGSTATLRRPVASGCLRRCQGTGYHLLVVALQGGVEAQMSISWTLSLCFA